MGCTSSKPTENPVVEAPRPTKSEVKQFLGDVPAESKPAEVVVDPKVPTLKINSVNYFGKDYAEAVQKLVTHGKLHLDGGVKHHVEDPAPGVPKDVHIVYKYLSQELSASIANNEHLLLQAPKHTKLVIKTATCGERSLASLLQDMVVDGTNLNLSNTSSSAFGGNALHFTYTFETKDFEIHVADDAVVDILPFDQLREEVKPVVEPTPAPQPEPVDVTPAPAPAPAPVADAVKVPSLMKGFINKEGGSRKTWNNRYFVLEASNGDSTVSYYVSSLDVAPFGKDLKGSFSLKGYDLQLQDEYLILEGKGLRTFKMELKDTAYRVKWASAFREHLKYANK